MSTLIRPEITKKSKYWISKHKYYELKHYCLQYPEWKKKVLELENSYVKSRLYLDPNNKGGDSVGDIAAECATLKCRMDEIKDTCIKADPYLWSYIFKAVTSGCSFTYLKTMLNMPAEKGMYYDRYRRFFYLLSNSH